MKQFTANIIKKLDFKNIQIGVMQFSTVAEHIFFFNSQLDKQEMIERIMSMSHLGDKTYLDRALIKMRAEQFVASKGDRPDADDVVIVVTDGESTNRQDAIDEAKITRDRGIRIITVGVTNDIDENYLKSIASKPGVLGQNYFKSETFEELDGMSGALVTSTCSTDAGGKSALNRNRRHSNLPKTRLLFHLFSLLGMWATTVLCWQDKSNASKKLLNFGTSTKSFRFILWIACKLIHINYTTV